MEELKAENTLTENNGTIKPFMTKCRMMALDLDGTLLRNDGKLSEYAAGVLREGIAAGVHMVVASGRSFDTLPEEILSFPGIEYAITSNGAMIYKMRGKECICAYKMKEKAVREIMRISEEVLESPLYEVFVDGAAFAPDYYVEDPAAYGAPVPKGVHYVKTTRIPCKDIREFIEEHIGDLDSFDVVLTDQVLKKKLWERLEAEAPGIYITASVPRYLEMSDEHSGKASAMQFLIDRLGISREETAAFGNADNDADMVEFSGFGVAVANASEGCKTAADYVCESNEEDGAAKTIHGILEGCGLV